MNATAIQTVCVSARLGARKSSASVVRSSVGLAKQALRPAARPVAVKATQQPEDFDATLELFAEKWEKTENKAVVGGYLVGAFFAIVVAEWAIHLPLFNVLLGFPIQFIGLLTVLNLGITHYVEKKGSLWEDAEQLVDKVSKQLPGLGK